MNTNSIKLFVLAAETLNISAAGQQLGLAPSVASAWLSKLEMEVGADLFHRTTRKVTLSIEGTEFLPYAKEILAQQEAAFAALGRGNPDVSGTLRFAASSTFAQHYVVPILAEFLARYPKINVELMLSDTQVKLIEGGYDLALRNLAAEDSSLIGRRLASDTRVLCASPEYLAAKGTPQAPEDLIEHQLLVFMKAKSRKLIASNGKRECTFPPASAKPRVVCDDGASIRIAAKAGVGICMSSIWNIRNDLKDGTLVRVLPEYHVDDQSSVWLVYPKSNVLTAKVRVFIDYLVEKIGKPPVWEQ
ncbi:LysR family transcriptional regulator [Enterovibrio norvegicus FF-454]|uniref:LysR family transcriptional regulator n=1 Tax=Enterovibrio norvegicus FF-454 TaxID=1185651 RepID=A0A1E5BZD0_9GAMM|nr:LysR family transcriptional regulator [Enterovibrio norvegicus]OEE58272.1 LysR family transcriptional regulator [Enterovibrio norvegicus FF-454]